MKTSRTVVSVALGVMIWLALLNVPAVVAGTEGTADDASPAAFHALRGVETSDAPPPVAMTDSELAAVEGTGIIVLGFTFTRVVSSTSCPHCFPRPLICFIVFKPCMTCPVVKKPLLMHGNRLVFKQGLRQHVFIRQFGSFRRVGDDD